jgi:DNA-binding transcriptional MerR regulator
MEYTIKEFADMANLTSRTLRYYDQIGLLKPQKISDSGYRIYTSEQTDRLQQILYYRSFGMELSQIASIVNDDRFDLLQALREHKKILLDKKTELNLQLAVINQSIAAAEGSVMMSDQEKFDGFKKNLLDENERKYGKEIREKYGDESVDASYARIKNMDADTYRKTEALGNELIRILTEAYREGDPAAALAQKAAEMHKEWLCCYWSEYSAQAHAAVARMYVEDQRFTAYYDKYQPGLAAFLRDAVLIYTAQ